jgi:hypothetical protein
VTLRQDGEPLASPGPWTVGRNIAAPSCFMAAVRGAPREKPEARRDTIRRLEQLRTLFQGIIDYNEPLLSKPGHQAPAGRRIAEATREIQSLDREIADLRD